MECRENFNIERMVLKMKKIGIIGSRRRNYTVDYADVWRAFKKIYKKDNIIISGGCPRGGDHFAEIIAKKLDIPIKIFRADWRLGKHAGFLRNTDIARESDILIACVAEDRKGGKEDTIKKFKKFQPEGKIHLC